MTIRPLRLFQIVLTALLIATGTASAKEIRIIKAEASSWKEWGTPLFLVDGDPNTAWVAGRKGVGPGKTLTFTLPQRTKIGMLRISNGNQGEGKFKEFRCVTRGILVLPDHGVHPFTLEPEKGTQDISFPQAVVSSFVIIIEEVSPAPGDPSMGEAKVAVSEVRVFRGSNTAKTPVAPKLSTTETKSPTTPTTPSQFTATKPGRLCLRAMVPATTTTPPSPGTVHPQASQEITDLVRAYYDRLATLRDNYTEIFIASIRDREQNALDFLNAATQRSKFPVPNINATPDSSGLSFDKPIVRGYSAMIRTHGTYRLSVNGKTYESPVDTLFSFAKENGVWLINGVQKRR